MMRYILLSGAAALALATSGCGKKAPETKPGGESVVNEIKGETDVKIEAVTPAATAYPLKDMTLKNEFVNAKATFPDGLGKIAPQLAEALEREADAEIGDLQTYAAEDKAERSEFFNPYELDIFWSPIIRSGHIISLQRGTYSYAGGAHSNSTQSGLIYDLNTNTGVEPSTLFINPGNANLLIGTEVTDQIVSEKMIRMGSAPEERNMYRQEVMENIGDEGVLSDEIMLLGSTVPGKFGGMLFMYSPYEMGPYAEGSYQAVVPQALFAGELKPDYSALFEGEPAEAEQGMD